MSKVIRSKITESLLIQRLGLDDAWSPLAAMPSFISGSLLPTEMERLQKAISKLIDAGCREEVLWFCLAELSPAAHETRRGLVETPIAPKNPDDDYTFHKRRQPIATREDLESVALACKKARKLISKYQGELSVAASALNSHNQFPSDGWGNTIKISDPVAYLDLLQSSLGWVEHLSRDWYAPDVNKVLRSKGQLYLSIYVKTVTRRFPERPVQEIVDLVSGGMAGSISKNLANFRQRYPKLYQQFQVRFKKLHQSSTH